MKKKFFSLPTKYAYLYFFIPFAVSIIVSTSYDNDIWFLLNQGRYVVTHGIPYIEPFTIHEGLDFVMQQHLAATIFYEVYHWLGGFGLSLLVIIINLLILFFLYKTALVMSDNRKPLSIFFAIGVDILLLMNFIQTRPQVFTYLILLILIYTLEKYQQTRKNQYLLFLPLLSLLEINLHASMWFMLFLFLLPYTIEMTIQDYQQRKLKRILPLYTSIILMFLAGLFNPYGIAAITYIFTSYGYTSINALVQEMQVPQLATRMGVIIYTVVLTVYIIYLVSKKRKIKLKYLCLLLGTTYLALSSYKGFAFFLLGGLLPLIYCIKEHFPQLPISTIKKTAYQQRVITFLFGLMLTLLIFLPHELTNPLKSTIDYLLSHYDKNQVILYTGFSEGGYVEYRGLKTYIDSRAEVFLKRNNHQKDIFQEYYNLQKGQLSLDKFINTYHFTHFIVAPNDVLYPYLQQEKEKFALLFSTDEYYLFKTK